MTAASAAPLLGRPAILRTRDLRIVVRVVDVRTLWGRTDYQITPEAGTGRAWVDSSTVDLLPYDARTPGYQQTQQNQTTPTTKEQQP